MTEFNVQTTPELLSEMIEEFDDVDPAYRSLVNEVFEKTPTRVNVNVDVEDEDVDSFTDWCDDHGVTYKML